MTKTTNLTTKKPGSAIMNTGLVIAAVGIFLIIAAAISGGSGTIYTWGLVILGLIVAAIGFGKRVLAALENR